MLFLSPIPSDMLCAGNQLTLPKVWTDSIRGGSHFWHLQIQEKRKRPFLPDDPDDDNDGVLDEDEEDEDTDDDGIPDDEDTDDDNDGVPDESKLGSW